MIAARFCYNAWTTTGSYDIILERIVVKWNLLDLVMGKIFVERPLLRLVVRDVISDGLHAKNLPRVLLKQCKVVVRLYLHHWLRVLARQWLLCQGFLIATRINIPRREVLQLQGAGDDTLLLYDYDVCCLRLFFEHCRFC